MAKKTVPVACPACNHLRAKPTDHPTIYECAKCSALHGSCYLGDSYYFVLPFWAVDPLERTNPRYFDLQCLGSEGVTRRHGWFDPETKRIVQTG